MIIVYILLVWLIVGYISGHIMYAREVEEGRKPDDDVLWTAGLWPVILLFELLFTYPHIFFKKLVKKKKKKKEVVPEIEIPQLTKPKKRSAKCK